MLKIDFNKRHHTFLFFLSAFLITFLGIISFSDFFTGTRAAVVNVLQNPTCDTNTSGITGYQATISRVTSPVRSGAGSCKATQSTGNLYTMQFAGSIANPQVGQQFSGAVYVRGDSNTGKPVYVAIRENGGSSASRTVYGQPVYITTSWQLVTSTMSIQSSGRTNVELYVVQEQAVAGNAFYVDDAVFTAGATAIEPTNTPSTRENFVQNWSFEQGTANWFLQKRGSANGTFTATNSTSTHGAYSAQVAVTATTTDPHDLELATYGIPVTSGKTYTLSFWAKASNNRTIDAVVQDADEPYTLYTRKTPSLNTNWQQFTYTFQATETKSNALVGFQVATATGTVWVDDVQLYEGTPSSTLPVQTLVKAINFNGPQLDVDGVTFQAQSTAGITTNGANFQNQGITLNPSVSTNKAQMIRSSIWRSNNVQLTVDIPIANGDYSVYVYTWEDTTSTTYNLGFEGIAKASNLESGSAGTWKKLGPYHVTVSDGSLSLFQSGGDFNLSGIEVYTSDGISAEEPTTDWWDPKWLSRRKITINNTASAESLVNFPLRVSLNSTNIDYAKTQNLGQDVRFVDADGVNVLSHEIERWDETGTSDLWVKVPQIDANSNADFIWMYYNNSTATDGQNAANVWNSSYAIVTHLNDGNISTVTDSTSNRNNGTKLVSASQPSDFTTGKIGHALDFAGGKVANTGISIPSSPASIVGLTNASYTFSAWVNPDTIPDNTGLSDYAIIGRRGNFSGLSYVNGQYYLATGRNTTSSAFVTKSEPTVFPTGNWAYVVQTIDSVAKSIKLYVNGVLLDSSTYSGTLRNYTSSEPYMIGRADPNGACSSGNYAWCMDGKIDEVRVSSIARSADWIEAEYASDSNSMNTFGNEESRNGTVTTLPGDISNLNYYLTNFNPWMQVQCGELRMDNGIDNPVPAGKTMMTSDVTCGTPGIIYSGDSQASFGTGQSSSTNQVVGGYSYPEVYVPSNSGGIFSSYNYLSSKVKASDTTPTNLSTICTLSNCTLPASLPQGTYTATGDVFLNGFTFPANQHYVFIIDGNLTIKGNILTPVGSTVVFSVSGNIIVPPAVGSAPTATTTNLAGIFSTDKSFIMQSTNSCADLRLNLAGVLIVNAAQTGGALQNNRDLCGNNIENPSLQIVQRLDFVVNLPELVRIQSITSNEVAP